MRKPSLDTLYIIIGMFMSVGTGCVVATWTISQRMNQPLERIAVLETKVDSVQKSIEELKMDGKEARVAIHQMGEEQHSIMEKLGVKFFNPLGGMVSNNVIISVSRVD